MVIFVHILEQKLAIRCQGRQSISWLAQTALMQLDKSLLNVPPTSCRIDEVRTAVGVSLPLHAEIGSAFEESDPSETPHVWVAVR